MTEVINVGIEELERSSYRQQLGVPKIPIRILSTFEVSLAPPIIVRPLARHRYEILFNEWVWFAAQRKGITDVPIIIRDDLSESSVKAIVRMSEQGIDENMVDRAITLKLALNKTKENSKEWGAQTRLSLLSGKPRATIAHESRLLKLSDPVLSLLADGKIKQGHAKALVSLLPDKQQKLANETVRDKLTVRQVEKKAQEIRVGRESQRQPVQTASAAKDPDTLRLQESLSAFIGSPVLLDTDNGRVIISYQGNNDILQGILTKWGYSFD